MSPTKVYHDLCIHWDYHPGLNTPAYGRGTNPAAIREYIRRVRPEVMQYHTIGAYGYANFPSRIAPVVPGLVGDPPAIWAQVCREEGTKFGCYMAAAACSHPDKAQTEKYRMVTSGGDSISFYCYNGPWIEEYFIPLVQEIMVRYRPCHLWMDGLWIPHDDYGRPKRAHYCICDHCRKKYREWFGRDMPERPDKMDWIDLQEFHERSMDDGIRRLAKAMHAIDPACALAGNTSYFFKDLRPPAAEIDWLSWDVLNMPSLQLESFEATYLATVGKPADIMIYESPCAYARPENIVDISSPSGARSKAMGQFRTAAQIKVETSILMANGVRLNFWHNPDIEGGIKPGQVEVAEDVSRFVRERTPWCIGSESMAEVAVLASRYQHCLDWDHLRYAVSSAQRMLAENHIPCNIVREDTLLQRLSQYRLVILPETDSLAPDMAHALREWMVRGGTVLCVATLLQEQCREWLSILAGDTPHDAAFNQPHSDADKTLRTVAMEGIPVILGRRAFPLAGSWTNAIVYNGHDAPWLAERPCGQGRFLVITSEICSDFNDLNHPRLRQLFGRAVRHALRDDLQVECEGPASVELTICRRAGDLYVHAVNLTVDQVQDMWPHCFYADVVEHRNLTLRVRVPGDCRKAQLMPEGYELPVTRSGDRLTITIPRLKHHCAVRFLSPESPA